jgi:hypothetical protein
LIAEACWEGREVKRLNKHTRLLVVMLFAILILLVTAIVVFYMDVNKGSQERVVTAEQTDSTQASHVFQGSNGLYGLMDASGNTVLEAEWQELSAIGNHCFLSCLTTGSGTLKGVIDQEGDIIVPFVYESIEPLTDFLYVGKLAEDGTYFFYNADFQLLLSGAWDAYSVVDETLCLECDGDQFVYGLGADLTLCEIRLFRQIRPISFTLELQDTELLRKMAWDDWCEIADMLMAYLDDYRRGHLDALEEITNAADLTEIVTASSTDFSWKGGAIDAISVVAAETEDDPLLQCSMVLTVEDAETTYSTCLQLTFSPDDLGDWKLCAVAFS